MTKETVFFLSLIYNRGFLVFFLALLLTCSRQDEFQTLCLGFLHKMAYK